MRSLGKVLLLALLPTALTVGGGYLYHNHLAAEEARQGWAQHQRELQLLRMEIDNDRLSVENARLAIDIAERTGKRPDPAELGIATSKLRADELRLSLTQNTDALTATLR